MTALTQERLTKDALNEWRDLARTGLAMKDRGQWTHREVALLVDEIDRLTSCDAAQVREGEADPEGDAILAEVARGFDKSLAPQAQGERQFPILSQYRHEGVASIPWSIMAPHERQAQANHDQSLERLAERGGLSPCEAVAILEDRPWRQMKDEGARVLKSIIEARTPKTTASQVQMVRSVCKLNLDSDGCGLGYQLGGGCAHQACPLFRRTPKPPAPQAEGALRFSTPTEIRIPAGTTKIAVNLSGPAGIVVHQDGGTTLTQCPDGTEFPGGPWPQVAAPQSQEAYSLKPGESGTAPIIGAGGTGKEPPAPTEAAWPGEWLDALTKWVGEWEAEAILEDLARIGALMRLMDRDRLSIAMIRGGGGTTSKVE